MTHILMTSDKGGNTMKHTYTLISIVTLTLVTIIGTLLYLIGFDVGYSKALDERFDASECKSSWHWRQRW